MSVKNKHVYASPARINEVVEETAWIGRHDYEVRGPNHVVIFAIPRNPKRFYAKRSPSEVEQEYVEEQAPKSRRSNGYNPKA